MMGKCGRVEGVPCTWGRHDVRDTESGFYHTCEQVPVEDWDRQDGRDGCDELYETSGGFAGFWVDTHLCSYIDGDTKCSQGSKCP